MRHQDASGSLSRSHEGDGEAAEQLLALVYDELRALAADFMQRERVNHTLQPTALVHEVYLRLVHQNDIAWKDRAHFIAVASHTIRRVLVDHARKHNAAKRGGGADHSSATTAVAMTLPDELDVLALDEAIEELGSLNDRQKRIVELRYFGGLTIAETADLLDISPATVKAEWALARAWLRQRLKS